MPDLALGGVIGMNGVRKSNSNGLLLLETCASHIQIIVYPPTPRSNGCTHAVSTGIWSIMFLSGEETGRTLEWQGRCAEKTAGQYLNRKLNMSIQPQGAVAPVSIKRQILTITKINTAIMPWRTFMGLGPLEHHHNREQRYTLRRTPYWRVGWNVSSAS